MDNPEQNSPLKGNFCLWSCDISHDIISFLKSHDSVPEGSIREPSPHCPKCLEKSQAISALSYCESPQCRRLYQRPRNIPRRLVSEELSGNEYV